METNSSPVPPELSAPFDSELGLVYTEVTPDGSKAELSVKPTLLQPAGIVHGGVYCGIIESLASVSAYSWPVSYTHLRAHETVLDFVFRLLLAKKKY